MANPILRSQTKPLSAAQLLAISEQRHRLLAENARDVVWSMSPAGVVTYISSAIEKLRGLTPDEAMAQTLDQILTPPSQAEVIDYYARLHAGAAAGEPLPSYRGELEYYRKDGSTFWTEVFAFPLVDDQGQLVEVIGVTRDIHERKQYEDSLKEARAQAEQASQAKSRFVAHISHEMRTPLSALLSWVQLAAQVSSSTEQRDLLQKSQSAGQLLLGIINDLLDLSRMEQSALRLQRKPLHLDEVLAQVRDLTLPLCANKPVVYQSIVDPQVPRHLVGDPVRLTQALLNLTSNAAQATATGQITVAVTLEPSGTEHQTPDVCLRFAVSDTGRGVSSQHNEHLFEGLVQVPDQNAPMAANTGAGLGLAITRRLAELMDGGVGFKSEPGKGSTFWFTCCLAPVIESTQADADNKADPEVLRGKRVLLVEDYVSLRQAMARTLSGLGVEVHEAENGLQALGKIRQTPFDLVLMDISMPVMDGKTCTQKIRTEFGAKVPVIGLTAAGFEEDREDLMALGMNEYLLKPFLLEELVAAMARHLDGSHPDSKRLSLP